MHVVVRQYKGASELMDALENGQSDIERLLHGVRGFISYYLVRTGDGGFSVTVCEDRIGSEESNLLAADWITENAPTVPGNSPEVSEGVAVIHFGR